MVMDLFCPLQAEEALGLLVCSAPFTHRHLLQCLKGLGKRWGVWARQWGKGALGDVRGVGQPEIVAEDMPTSASRLLSKR